MAIGGLGHPARDVRHDRERRVHQHDARHDGGIEVIVDLRGVEAGGGIGRKEMCQKIGAGVGSSFRMSDPPASSARTARSPVPAEGSRTRSAGVMAAAEAAIKPSGIGVENC